MFSKPSDPFSEMDAVEKEQAADIEGRIKNQLKHFGEVGQEMMDDPRYRVFHAEYESILGDVLRLMIWFNERGDVDPFRFYAKMTKFQNQVRVLSSIVELPSDFKAKADDLNKPPAEDPNEIYEVPA